MEINSQIIKIEELEKRLNSLNKKIATEAQNVETINKTMETVNQSIDELSADIDKVSLELEEISSGTGTGGSCSCETESKSGEMFNCFDKIVLTKKIWGTNNIRHDRLYFICKPGVWTKIKIKADIFFETSQEQECYTVFSINATGVNTNKIFEEFYTVNGTFSKSIEFEYEFIPTKEDNMVLIYSNPATSTTAIGHGGFTYMEFSIFGMNTMILTRRHDLKIFLTKDNYYITKNLDEGAEYLITPSSNVNLNGTYTKVGNVTPTLSNYQNRFFPYNYMCVPEIIYNSETGKYEFTSTPMFYFAYTYNGSVYLGKENPGETNLTSATTYGPSYTVGHPLSTGVNHFNLGLNYSLQGSYLCYSISNSTTAKKTGRMKFNGANMEGYWVDNCSVFAKDWEDFPGQRPNYYIGINNNAELYFFPAVESTYRVYIGRGCQVNAYMQSDLSINVYYRWLTDVHKKVLKLNEETNMYELQEGEEIFQNAYEIIEGIGNDYFINKLGTWDYVSSV